MEAGLPLVAEEFHVFLCCMLLVVRDCSEVRVIILV